MKARKRSKLALASFILAICILAWPIVGSFIIAPILMIFQLNEDALFNWSIYLGVFSFLLLGIAAIITGIMALYSMKKHKLSGTWMAWAGIIIGAIPVVWIVPLLISIMLVR